jgi:hypothetical protein
MPLVQFLRAHTHASVDFVAGEKTEMNLADAELAMSRGILVIVSPTVDALQRLEAQTLIASKNKSCCFR